MSNLHDATTDELIAELEARGRINPDHIAYIELATFTMKHNMHCQPDLEHCSIHKWLNDRFLDSPLGMSPVQPGTYKVEYLEDVKSHALTRIEDE